MGVWQGGCLGTRGSRVSGRVRHGKGVAACGPPQGSRTGRWSGYISEDRAGFGIRALRALVTCWSGREDLNLRPLAPEAGQARLGRATPASRAWMDPQVLQEWREFTNCGPTRLSDSAPT